LFTGELVGDRVPDGSAKFLLHRVPPPAHILVRTEWKGQIYTALEDSVDFKVTLGMSQEGQKVGFFDCEAWAHQDYPFTRWEEIEGRVSVEVQTLRGPIVFRGLIDGDKARGHTEYEGKQAPTEFHRIPYPG
ncbi:MAG: hypothetical protein KDB53_15100, partial [Planctomycetes bacterium]|nr:hypothetical protein [Planctomycetota bacterium]